MGSTITTLLKINQLTLLQELMMLTARTNLLDTLTIVETPNQSTITTLLKINQLTPLQELMMLISRTNSLDTLTIVETLNQSIITTYSLMSHSFIQILD